MALASRQWSSRPLWMLCVFCALSIASEAITAQTSDCLAETYGANQPTEVDQQFDANFDRNEHGQSFSCELLTSASSAQRSLETFRLGFLYDSRSHIAQSVRFPLTISKRETLDTTAKGKPFTVNNFDEWLDVKHGIFDDHHQALIACSSLHTVRIFRNRGFAISQGLVWFTGEDVKVGAINLIPITDEDLLRECVVAVRSQ